MATSPPPLPLVGWRPPQWTKPAMVMITVPAGYTSSSNSNTQPGQEVPANGTILVTRTNKLTAAVSYVFDAVLALDHDQALVKTNHPVQTGASVSSHAYIEPADLVLNVLMSDAAQQYVGANQSTSPYIQQWTGDPSKSVSAYLQMLQLQSLRVPLTVTTRLRTYSNMLILRVSPREDHKTIAGARFRIEFSQLFIANTQSNPISARPEDTDATGLGAVSVQPPGPTVDTQFNVEDAAPSTATGPTGGGLANMTTWLTTHPSGVDVPGAGSYSSSNTNNLQQLPSPR